MSMPVPPPDTRAVGQVGHVADHNTISDILTGLESAVTALQSGAASPPGALSIINVTSAPYNADPTNKKSAVAAIQGALNAIANGSASALYIPPGDYDIDGQLTYTGNFPLYIFGGGTAGRVGYKNGTVTNLHINFPAPGHAIHATNTPFVRISGMDFWVDATNTLGPTADYCAVYTSNVQTVQVIDSQVGKGSGNFSVNTAFHFVYALNGGLVRGCSTNSEQQGVWMDGGAGLTVEDSFIGTTVGNGYGAIRMDNASASAGGAATIQLTNVVTFRGDWGFYGGGSGNEPLFIFMDNVQINNPRAGGMYLQAGSQVWLNYVWISMAATPAGFLTHGIVLDTGFLGWFYMLNSVIQSPSGHGLWAKGGKGIVLDAVSFGGCGHSAANTYDDVHIGTGASNVAIGECHFDVDQYNTIANPGARSAIYVEPNAGDVLVTGSHGAGPFAYGSGPVLDFSNKLIQQGCIGLGMGDSVTSSSSPGPVTGTSYAQLTPAFTSWPYEARTGVGYRLQAWGSGTQGSTAEQLSIQGILGPTLLNYIGMPATDIPASGNFHWEAELKVLCTGTGANGTADVSMKFTWNQTAIGGGRGTETWRAAGVAFNTINANIIELQALWGGAPTTPPTINCDGAWMERIQNYPVS